MAGMNLAQDLERSAQNYPYRPAVGYGTGRFYDYATLAERVARLAGALRERFEAVAQENRLHPISRDMTGRMRGVDRGVAVMRPGRFAYTTRGQRLDRVDFGKRVALIERAPHLGGAGINTGTVPSKTLRESALYYSGLRQHGLYGVDYSLREGLTVGHFMYRERIVVENEWSIIRRNLDRHRIETARGQVGRPAWLGHVSFDEVGRDGQRGRGAAGDGQKLRAAIHPDVGQRASRLVEQAGQPAAATAHVQQPAARGQVGQKPLPAGLAGGAAGGELGGEPIVEGAVQAQQGRDGGGLHGVISIRRTRLLDQQR